MPHVKRPDQARPSRRERARATRWRIARAAYRLFCEQGYADTTMAQIAAEAGVAVQTVYFAFRTKSVLLSRAYEVGVGGEDDPRRPDEQTWFAAMAAEPDITRAVRHLVSGSGEIMRRVTPLYNAARAAADTDAEAAQVMAFHENDRAASYRELIALLRTKQELRHGLTLDRATDLLLLLIGMDVYHALVDGRGWSHEEWINWTASVVAEQIFGAM